MNVPKLQSDQKEPVYRLVKEETSEEGNLKLATCKPTLKRSAWKPHATMAVKDGYEISIVALHCPNTFF